MSWKKQKKYESRYSQLGIYGDIYENNNTGNIIWIDKVIGKGGAVFMLKKGESEPFNLFGEGTGFRTKRLAERYARDWMKKHPNG